MTKPNFIFILIDDLGWRDLACCGSRFYLTPHLDRLAAEGLRFTQAYASCPVCSPTRASLLTGRYPARVGVTNFIGGRARGRLIDAPYVDHLPLEEFALPKALKTAGYRTWHVGKWHLGGRPFYPEAHGFEVNLGGCEWGMPKHGYFSPYRCPTLSDGPTGEYLTDRLTDEAIRLIRRHDGSPFFLNFCHYAVHIPIQVKEAERGRFAERARELGLEELKTFEEGPAFPCEHKKDQRIVRRLLQSDPAYAAMMWNLDQNVGRLLAAVDEAGLRENTLVVFTSDNGGLATAEGSPTCNLPLAEGKGWMYEGGTRVPLLIRWPAAVRPGRVCDAPLTSPDFYPTFLELAGLDPLPKQHCDGRSFAAVLRGAEQFGRGPLFWHYPHYGNQGGTPGASVRDGDHILLEFYEDNRAELYNLREDEGERRNLAEQRPDLVRDLRTRLTEWRTQVNAVLPSPNPDCQPW